MTQYDANRLKQTIALIIATHCTGNILGAIEEINETVDLYVPKAPHINDRLREIVERVAHEL